MKSLSPIIFLLAAALPWAGCTTAQVQITRSNSTRIEAHEAIAIVVSHDGTELASESVLCVTKALHEKFPAIRFILSEEFHRAAFPDMALEFAPRALIYLPLLLNDPAFRARIAPLGFRYLIAVRGKTEEEGNPIVGGFGGPGGAVTVLGWSADRKSTVTAEILDLKQDTSRGEIKASAEGKPWFVCVGALVFCAPLGAPAFTEAKACSEIASAVAGFFDRHGDPQPVDVPQPE
jgi:hypothetical protein